MRIGGQQFDERVLDAAEALLVERGYERLSAVEAANRAGVDIAGDVPSDWDLFAAIMERDETRFNTIVEAAVAQTPAPGERLLAVIEACVVDYDWGYWIVLWSLALRDERAKRLSEGLNADFRALIATLIEDGRAAGEFHVDDVESAALAISTLIDALAVEATLGDDTVSPNFMLGACASSAGRLVGTELRLRRSENA